jgi:spore coat protein H
MKTFKRNARALIVLVAIVYWSWSRSKDSSDQGGQRVVRHQPAPVERYEPNRYRPNQPGMDFPSLSAVDFDVSKITSSLASTRGVQTDIQISEIFYHPTEAMGKDTEFIELHHAGDVPVNMGAWSLTKGVKFSFPEGTTLEPGETVIVCKDLTRFRQTFGETPKVLGAYKGGLKNSGETIRLKDGGGTTYLSVEYSDKPPWSGSSDGAGDSLQLKHSTSNPTDPSQWGTLSPTPGRTTFHRDDNPTNSVFGVSQQPAAPTESDHVLIKALVSLADMAAKLQFNLEINGELFVHDIETAGHFHNRGSNGQLTVNLPPLPQNTVVRYWFSIEDSQNNRFRFPPVDRPTPNEAFWVQGPRVESKLPVYHLMMDQQDMMRMHSSGRSDQTYPATFVFDGEVYDQVKVRVRGAYARSWPKKSLKIFFNKDKLFRGESRINLNSGWRDPSLIREHLSYRIYDLAEAYSLKTQHVHLEVNGGFWGLFTTIQQPDKRYLEDQGLKGAALYKADSRSNQSDERMFHSVNEYERHYEKETREEDSYADLADFCKGLETANDLADFLEQRVQIERYINFLCAGTLCQNWDGFNKNHFIGFEADNTGRAFALPWDLDRTLGDYWDWSFDYYQLPLFLGAAQQPGVTGWNRMADRLFDAPSLRAVYIQRLKQLVETVFTEERLFAYIDTLADQIEPEADLDRTKWGGDRNWRGGMEQVKYFIKHRRDFLKKAIEIEETKNRTSTN